MDPISLPPWIPGLYPTVDLDQTMRRPSSARRPSPISPRGPASRSASPSLVPLSRSSGPLPARPGKVVRWVREAAAAMTAAEENNSLFQIFILTMIALPLVPYTIMRLCHAATKKAKPIHCHCSGCHGSGKYRKSIYKKLDIQLLVE